MVRVSRCKRLVVCSAMLLCAGPASLLRGSDGEVPNAAPRTLRKIDIDLLDDLSRRSFRYFLEQTDPRTGLVLDPVPDGSETHHRKVTMLDVSASGCRVDSDLYLVPGTDIVVTLRS